MVAEHEFRTLREIASTPGACMAVFSEARKYDDWYLVLSVHRESDALDRSNWRVLLKRLGGEHAPGIAIIRFSHCLVGWMDHLMVSPRAHKRLAIARDAMESIEQYPILDESDFSDLEYDDFYTWAESELKQFPAWPNVLESFARDELYTLDGDSWGSGYIGEPGSECALIEATRKVCEWLES